MEKSRATPFFFSIEGVHITYREMKKKGNTIPRSVNVSKREIVNSQHYRVRILQFDMAFVDFEYLEVRVEIFYTVLYWKYSTVRVYRAYVVFYEIYPRRLKFVEKN